MKRIGIVLSYVIVALAASAVTALYDRVPRSVSGCVSDVHVVSQSAAGDLINMMQEICGGMAYSTTISLALQKRGSGNSTVFFTYERNNSEPHIAWTAPNAIAVELADVGHIYVQKDVIDGVRVQYRIGHAVE